MTANKLLLRCPKCSRYFAITIEQSDKSVTCSNCRQLIKIPDLTSRFGVLLHTPPLVRIPSRPLPVPKIPAEKSFAPEIIVFLCCGVAAASLVIVGLLSVYFAYSHRIAGNPSTTQWSDLAGNRPKELAKGPDTAINENTPRQQQIDKRKVNDQKEPSVDRGTAKNQPPIPATTQQGSYSTQEIVARCEPSVAIIKGKLGLGSGFIVKENVLATNAHVIEDEFPEDLEIHFPSAKEVGSRGPFKSTAILYEDRRRDLALLSIDVPLLPLEVAGENEFIKGEDIVIIGSPGGIENVPIKGTLGTRQDLNGMPWYQFSAPTNPGNSGGPVLNYEGKVLGVHTLGLSRMGFQSLAFCVPASALKAELDQVPSADSEKAMQVTSIHRPAVAFRRIDALCNCYMTGLAIYVKHLRMDTQKTTSVDAAIAAAREEIVKFTDDGRSDKLYIAVNIKNQMLIPGLESAVFKISSDPHIEQRVRDDIVKLWAICAEMNKCFNSPRGDARNIEQKRIELENNFNRYANSLKSILGVDLK
jgi:S1-C subfamily serine protease